MKLYHKLAVLSSNFHFDLGRIFYFILNNILEGLSFRILVYMISDYIFYVHYHHTEKPRKKDNKIVNVFEKKKWFHVALNALDGLPKSDS